MEQNQTKRNRLIMMLTRLVLAVGVMGLGVAYAEPAAAQQLKVGYVDLQRALNQVAEGRAAKKRLEKEFEQKQQQLDAKQDKAKELKNQLDSGMMLSDEAKQKKAIELQRQLAELQQMYMKMQRDLAQKEAKATAKIFSKMGEIVEDMAKEQGYDLILEKTESSVLFASEGMDLTDELIERYDK